MDARSSPLSFIGKPPSAAFDFRHIALASGFERPCGQDEWKDTLVVVERGAVDLVCANGAWARFERGDVLCLCRVSLLLLRNPGRDAAVLSAVSRNHMYPPMSFPRRGV